MKTFNSVCAQGDLYISKIDAIPSSVVRVSPEGNQIIVTHSGTGHPHVMAAETVEMYRSETNFDWDAWLIVKEPTPLRHLRGYDTHEPIMFEPGIYHVRRQREYVPDGFRRVED